MLKKSSAVGVEWQQGGAFDLSNEHWRPKVFSSEDVFGIGEMKLLARRAMEEAEKGQALERPDHVLAAQGVDVSDTARRRGAVVEVSLEPYVAARCDDSGADGTGSNDGEADAGNSC